MPLLVLIADQIFGLSKQTSADLGNPAQGGHPSKRRIIVTLLYALCALLWAFASVAALSRTITQTGVICPIGRRIEQYIPQVQLAMCALDATLIIVMTRLRNQGGSGSDSGLRGISGYVSNTLFVSALVILVSCKHALDHNQVHFMAFNLYPLDISHLLGDSILASGIIISGMQLLATLHPTTVALLGSSILLFGFQIPFLHPGFLIPPLAAGDVIKRTAVVAILHTPLVVMALPPRSSAAASSNAATMHKRIAVGYGTIISFSFLASILMPTQPITTTTAEAVHSLTASGRTTMQEWTAQAASSKTLAEAVNEYKRRYKISPPPNFDKWYEFATEHNSPVIDDFDQIHRDLLPFWGVAPLKIRQQTLHLMTYETIGMGGMRFRNGTLEQAPTIPGSHHWMTDVFDEMSKPFAQWLPDMDLVMNLGDESHVSVPYEKMQEHLANADKAVQRASTTTDLRSFSLDASTWPDNFPEDVHEHVVPDGWRDLVRTHIFELHVSSACAPSSKARTSRWWDWSAACGYCAAPHSSATRDGLLLANTTLALDLCHQPDMSYLNGFIMSPGAMMSSNELFPIFSQARISGFTDILFPSPWDFTDKSAYKEESDPAWHEKSNSLYWRGSPSDGLAAFGTWAGYMRGRFVHEAYEHSKQIRASAPPTPDAEAFSVNASFAGEVTKCDREDCRVEDEIYRHWGLDVLPPSEQADPTQMPPPQPYEENFRHRFLIDMDGAGFSGRFIPFLKSRSLVYRAAVFHTWVDDRVKAWQHYIPVDARLGSGFWALVDYLAGRTSGGATNREESAGGEEVAKRVAEQGRQWADKALRKEDMQVYLFRLMLEWARVVDDERESIGFAGV